MNEDQKQTLALNKIVSKLGDITFWLAALAIIQYASCIGGIGK